MPVEVSVIQIRKTDILWNEKRVQTRSTSIADKATAVLTKSAAFFRMVILEKTSTRDDVAIGYKQCQS